jgi:serine/threonine-protein kinase
VAVKVIHRHLRESKEIAARFVSEAHAVAKLKHPNIVEVYDVSDEDSAERYLIVELVRGTTLRKLIAEVGHMPAEVAAAIGMEIGGALDHAHEQGVIHRDVKPENVLVELRDPPVSNRTSQERTSENSGPRVKITDFGIAKLLDAQGVTSTGQVLGSPAHMSPEQIEGGDVTARSDVFGLGVLLYECMVGRLPFDGKNPAQVLRRVLDGTFTPPDRARPTVGAQFSRIIEKALAREADGRYETARELVDALKGELERVGMTDPRRELAEFLADPKAYAVDYEPRIVKRLVELGRDARAERQLPAAAAYFNRALAFRPDDTELIKQVAGLAQTERMKRFALRAGAILAGSAVLGAIAFGVTRLVQKPTLPPAEPEPEIAPIVSITPRILNSTPPKPRPSAEPVRPKVVRVIPTEPAPGNDKPREVRVVVTGAIGGRVQIDGEGFNHFGQTKMLSPGVHTFEAFPPDKDKDCCDKPPPQAITVVAGEGVQEVRLHIPLRKASIALVGPPEASASCSQFFTETLSGGQSKTVAVSKETAGTCLVTGPEGAPKSIPVSLRPGKNVTLTWP